MMMNETPIEIIEPRLLQAQAKDALLFDYATGSLDGAVSLIVGSYLQMNPAEASQLKSVMAVGAALLEGEAEEPLSADFNEKFWQRFAAEKTASSVASQPRSSMPEMFHWGQWDFPGILAPYFLQSRPRAELSLMKGLKTFELQVNDPDARMQLICLDAGVKAPAHAHGGMEITLLVDGAFRDEHGSYTRGDLIIEDETTGEHQPHADDRRGCVCLSVTMAPVKFKNWAARIIAPFLR